MLNKAIIMGRITRDLELRYSQTNVAICRFTVAVDRRFVKQGEERQTDFISVVSFGKTAEFVQRYFEKGRMINVIGAIQTGSYEKDGRTVYTTDVVADEVNFCGDKRSDSASGGVPVGVAASNGDRDDGFMPVETDDDLPF